MSVTGNGRELIFMISQPRAGSTLLQRILGAHPDIHTVSEPWLMLHPLYGLRETGHVAEYGTEVATEAVRAFLHDLDGSDENYFAGVREMYSGLYGRALAKAGKRLFLDKTPRYYLIIPELCRTFPEARFVILMRNPLSVLCSIVSTWVKGEWEIFAQYEHDLLSAPRLLTEGVVALGESCASVQYETLVADPEEEVRRLCQAIDVEFLPEMVDYGARSNERWSLGDQAVYNHERPRAENAQKWVKAVADPRVWRLAWDYLESLGSDTLEKMGYSCGELAETLRSCRPSRRRLCFTTSLESMLQKPRRSRGVSSRWRSWIPRLKSCWRRKAGD